jgi:poly(3-hydroxybutyrate) depolymerase
MDAASQQSYTQMDRVADREKFIVVYPNAINKVDHCVGFIRAY